jgi:FkbH-like protein
MGRDVFYSAKMWYLGKIPFSAAAQKAIADFVAALADRVEAIPCKALLLDLDNTLWGGIVGEEGLDGIQLSDHQEGTIYKDVQRAVKRIQGTGVILGIVSKNNEADAMEVIEKHPHMVLRSDDFAVKRINWLDKADNMRSIAQELNIGLDAMVFVDDNPMEREAMKGLLPQVHVPDFPQEIEVLPAFVAGLYERYFFKFTVTEEDKKKTEQYRSNAKRAELQNSTADYAGFLRQLQLRVKALPLDESNVERLTQLLGKTNQFNLTTRRYSMADIVKMREGGTHLFYLFSARDKFGEYGIISAVIVNLLDVPRIDSFVMSCRVMGKLVENYIVSHLERDLRRIGYSSMEAEYIPSAKNAPVEMLFEGLGYKVINEDQGHKVYRVDLERVEPHEHYVMDGEDE